jgi:hypothetical protein
VPDRAEENKTGPFAADVASYRLHPAAENKAKKTTIGIYTDAARWFAAFHRTLVAIEHGIRRAHLAGITVRQDGAWTMQAARCLLMGCSGRSEEG